MKTLKQIAKELQKILKGREYINPNTTFKFYTVLSGHYADEYYNVSLLGTDSRKEIEVTSTADNPQAMIDLIKAIEPKAVIMYTETITKERTV